MKPVILVSMTKSDPQGFLQTPLGRTFSRIKDLSDTRITYSNTAGCSEVYNRFLIEEYAGKVLMFVHDDVYLEDYWVVHRVIEALKHYDVVGIVGQDYPFPAAQWNTYEGHQGVIAHWNVGAVAMGEEILGSRLSFHARSPRQCYALDGQFLAMDVDKVLSSGARFDAKFAFGFYDTDFCRTATKCGLTMGVWPIVATHVSSGRAVGTEMWYHEMALYKEKWEKYG